MTTVKITIYISILIQLISTSITWNGMFLTLNKPDVVLQEILIIENLVQTVELLFYIYIYYWDTAPDKMGGLRYIDWVITTPLMLFTTVLYMEYNNTKDKGEPIDVRSFLRINKNKLYKIFVNNLFMLLCGFLVEKKIISMYLGISLGFFFFYQTFMQIHTLVGTNNKNILLFRFLVIVWGMYGFAAIMSDSNKNISYNLLDIVAKNFYGIYIYYLVRQVSI